jgi:hypothetical protein
MTNSKSQILNSKQYQITQSPKQLRLADLVLKFESEYSSQLRCADAFSAKMAMTRAME